MSKPEADFASGVPVWGCLDQHLVMKKVTHLPIRTAAVSEQWLLYTRRCDFPPPLIVAIKHTSVKYPHYSITVYTYVLIQVGISVWGSGPWLRSRWKLSSLFFSLSLPPSHPFSFTLHIPHLLFLHAVFLPFPFVCALARAFAFVTSCEQHMCSKVLTGLFCLRDKSHRLSYIRLRVAWAHMDLNAAY